MKPPVPRKEDAALSECHWMAVHVPYVAQRRAERGEEAQVNGHAQFTALRDRPCGIMQRANGHNVVRVGEFNLTPPPSMQPLLVPYDGKPLLVGIRAENMETLASPVEDALRAYTAAGAFAGFAEADTGVLRAGMLADLVVLDRDITTPPAETIRETQVLLTVVGGIVVHDRLASDGDVLPDPAASPKQ
jgi:hypothetical protein